MNTVALPCSRRPVLLPAVTAMRPEATAAEVIPGSKAHAALLFPDSDVLQMKWLRAVSVVRSTKHGWVLDRGVQRRAQ